MNIFFEEHKRLIKQLLDGGVAFILVGGYAVVYHGYGRTTGDMDIWLKPDNSNKEKLVDVLKKNLFVEEDLKQLINTDFTQSIAFHFGEPPKRVDFITSIQGLSYVEADLKKVFLSMDNYQVPILHIHDLIVNKMTTGRLKDQADVDELQKIMRSRNKDS